MKTKKHPGTSGLSRNKDIPIDSSTKDLLSLILTRTFVAVVIGMLLYTLVEFLIDRPADVPVFITHHVLHVAVIGVAVWVVSSVLISRLVIKPVDHVFIHLRRVASGRLEYLDIEAGSTQLGGVIGSLNALVARLRRTPEDDSVSRALDHVRELRTMLSARMNESDEANVPVMRLVTKLEGELLDVMQEHPATSSNPLVP
jgi:methyl-accepting chemotaxis protein